MRARMIAAVAALTVCLLVAATAAQSAAPTKRYLRFSADAAWSYTIDYGDESYMVFNGTFTWYTYARIRGIAVYSGGRVTIPEGWMLIESKVTVADERTIWSAGGPRIRSRCDSPSNETIGLLPTSGAYISISNSGLYVNPGRGVVSSTCVATESLIHHNLSSGPAFTLSAPAKSRFSRRAAFSTQCSKSHTHDWQWNGDQKHKFTGSTLFAARFTPFPAAQLPATKKRFRAMVGTTASPLNVPERQGCPS